MDVRTHDYFPIHFIALGVGLFAVGIIAYATHVWLTPIAIVFGFLLTSTHYRFRIDKEAKTYQDYLWILGFKIGDQKTFDRIDHLYVTSQIKEQVHGSIAIRFNSEVVRYIGYIRFDGQDDVFLAESSLKSTVLKKLQKIADKLDLELDDEA